MKRLIVLSAVLGLCGCQPPVSAPSAAKPVGIVQFTDADLTNAIAIAQAAPNNPRAGMIAMCFTFLKSQLANLPSAQPGTNGTMGVASAFVVADLALSNIANATGPASQAAFAMACGPLIAFQANQAVTITGQIAMIGALIVPK